MKKPKPVAVKGYPICSNCHPEGKPIFNEKDYNESADGMIYCSKCGRVVFIYKDFSNKLLSRSATNLKRHLCRYLLGRNIC